MKASIKFRDDKRPILKAKVPLNILGFQFQSGIEAGESRELCLNFNTLFESGPLFKFSYRPKDSCNPFSLGVRTGIGHFGSPISAPMTMSAEFNLLGHGNPSFFLHFRPQIGDFSIKRSIGSQIALPSQSQSSIFVPKIKAHAKDVVSENEESVEGIETPLHTGGNRTGNGIFSGERVLLPAGTSAANAIDSLCSGMEVCARTALPLRDRALMKLRWSVRFPAELKGSLVGDGVGNQTAEISSDKFPCLVLSKIGVEHVPVKQGPQRDADVAETCFAVKRELDVLQAESGLLRKRLDELRSEIGAVKSSPTTGNVDSGEVERNGGKFWGGKKRKKERKESDSEGHAVKVTDGNVTTSS